MRTIKTDITEPKTEEIESKSIRPVLLKEYIGQADIKRNLEISMKAARKRNLPLDHFLLSGAPGLGKTSLAAVIANEMNAKLRTVSAPVIEKTGDMASILASLEENDILFIDEIHRLPRAVEEFLYSAMEDFKIEILVGSVEQAKIITMELPRFTLIGATTREGMLTKPLMDRFANHYRLTYYKPEELADIIRQTADKYGTPFPEDMAFAVGKASRGTPRIANNLTKKISDYLLAEQKQPSTKALSRIFEIIGINEEGLTAVDEKYISILRDIFPDKAVGLNTIAAYLGESEDTVRDTIEPYLIRQGMILRTGSGRILNPEYVNRRKE